MLSREHQQPDPDLPVVSASFSGFLGRVLQHQMSQTLICKFCPSIKEEPRKTLISSS